MDIKPTFAGAIGACLAMIAQPIAAAPYTRQSAENLRSLDIMLMVTALRCRTTAYDFQADYNQFAAKHLARMNQAGSVLQADLAKQYGAAGAKKALDKVSVGMANRYGQGHPWLDCQELGEVTRELAATDDEATLLAAAEELLGAEPGRIFIAMKN